MLAVKTNIPDKTTRKKLQDMGWFITGRQLDWLKKGYAELKFVSPPRIIDWEYCPPLTSSDKKVSKMISDWKKGDTLPAIVGMDIIWLLYGYSVRDIMPPCFDKLSISRQKQVETKLLDLAKNQGGFFIVEGHHRYTGYKIFESKTIPMVTLLPETFSSQYIK